MPTLTRWFIKSALLYLVAALLAAVVDVALPGSAVIGALRPAYLHLFVVGWITQMIFGVAYWMFPRFSRDRPRGNAALGWTTYVLLNLGLLLRLVGEPLETLSPEAGLGWLLVGSATSQWLAGTLFVANTWARVRER
jgi:hypothetical protein